MDESGMLYYVIRRREDKEPLALCKVNAKQRGDMELGDIIRYGAIARFGPVVKVSRMGVHVFSIIVGNNDEVAECMEKQSNYNLEEVTQAEWESWAVMELFPVLRMAVAR